MPCRKILDCWWLLFDVEDFLRRHFDEAELQAILAPPRDKAATIWDLIEKARGTCDPTD
ncbi:MAG: hypothetical protein HQ546_03675 [Planctomycetes bacterium]|nr:hypothetical protein [Planctomycetota bacterium]